MILFQVPITSAKVYEFLHDGTLHYFHRRPNGFENYTKRAQTICPLYTRNMYKCSASQELLSFKYQRPCTERNIRISSDTRIKRVEFIIERDCVVTGFGSYFQLSLYKDVTMNNQKLLRSNNTNCIPMAYFPLKTPQTLNAQDRLKAVFWLHAENDKRKHWYEWHTTAPHLTSVHNLTGNAFALQHLPQ